MQKRVIILLTIILSLLPVLAIHGCTGQIKPEERSTIPITTLYAAKQRNDLGVKLTNEAKYEEAITELNGAIEIYPSYAPAYYNRGNVYYCTGEFEKAIKDYDTAIKLDTEFHEAYNNRGLAYAGIKEFNMAIADFTVALDMQPSNAEYYYNRGNASMKAGMEQWALDDFNSCIRLSRDASLTLQAEQAIQEIQNDLH